jgi:hypothetical protein
MILAPTSCLDRILALLSAAGLTRLFSIWTFAGLRSAERSA